MTRKLLRLAAFSVVCLAIAQACTASNKKGTGDFALGGAGGAAVNQGAGPTGSGGSVGTLSVGAGGSTGSGCDTTCSADLHDVLDCNGGVVMHCPDDKGCGMGGCVDPCEAAKENASTIGCDFYAVTPSPESETTGSCFAALVANTWTSPVTLTADYGGQKLDISQIARIPSGTGQNIQYNPLPNGQLPPGQIAIVFLSNFPSGQVYWVGCPSGTNAGITQATSISGTGLGSAFHITTSAPIVAYDIYPYGGAQSFVSSATLLLPTQSWGTNTIAADAFQEDPVLEPYGGSPFVQVVAAEDNTTVSIAPVVDIQGGSGVNPTPKGSVGKYTLNRGQVLQFLQSTELAGSAVQSDKPTSLWGGSGCMHIPLNVAACDSAHQQLLPISALGHEYVGARYRDRQQGSVETVPWTIVGVATDQTVLSWDPAPPSGAPTVLVSGQVATFDASGPFSVKSQDEKHPFYIATHMTGGDMAATLGDPEYVNVVPPQQYLNKYLFLTDPTYGNTHLVFVRQKAKDGTFKDVNLDCAGNVGGWQPVGNSGQYQTAGVDITAGGSPQGGCDNGVHVAKSDAPFGLTVWGWDPYVSYGYPAGMSVKPINTVVVPPTPK